MAAQDLITTTDATAYLAAGGVTLSTAQAAQLAALVTDASQLICREAGRYFVQTSYDEVLRPVLGQPDKGDPDTVYLSYPPVQSVTRVASGRTTALTVANTDTTTNQRALVQFVATGDPTIQLSYTGVTLTRWASGVATTSTLSFTTYTTVQALANQINTLGNGWTATVATGMGGWASADLWGPSLPMGALSPPGVSLDVFGTDLTAAAIDEETGVLAVPNDQAAYGGGPGQPWQWPGSADVTLGSAGFRAPVRVSYSGGWPTVPLPVQRACAELVKAVFSRLAVNDAMKSENAEDYSYTLREAWESLPDHVRKTVWKYRLPR